MPIVPGCRCLRVVDGVDFLILRKPLSFGGSRGCQPGARRFDREYPLAVSLDWLAVDVLVFRGDCYSESMC